MVNLTQTGGKVRAISRDAMLAEAEAAGNRWRVETLRDDCAAGTTYYLVDFGQVRRTISMLDDFGMSFALTAFVCNLALQP